MASKIKYKFSNKLWKDKLSSWYFVSLPKDVSKEIRDNLQWQEEGWGRMKATATIKSLDWSTSIWFDTTTESYILPVKKEIRKKLSLIEGDLLEVDILV